jgi:hypothetical protein
MDRALSCSPAQGMFCCCKQEDALPAALRRVAGGPLVGASRHGVTLRNDSAEGCWPLPLRDKRTHAWRVYMAADFWILGVPIPIIFALALCSHHA